MDFQGWAKSDTGTVRTQNQDSYLLRTEDGLFAVADGIGGKEEGGRASMSLVERLDARSEELAELARNSDPATDRKHRDRVLWELQETIQHGNTDIFQEGEGSMGTTVDALLLAEGVGFIAHVGDSRIYLIRDGEIFQLTDDHTFAEKLKRERREAFERGHVDVERFEHVLTRSVGTKPCVEVDTLFIDVQVGDRFILCSDGLSDGLDEESLLEVNRDCSGELFADTLIREAKHRDGTDNITAVVVDVPSEAPETRELTSTIDTLRKVIFLEQIKLFANLHQQDLVKVLRIVYKRVYRDGEYVLHRGERGDSLFMILEGEISLRIEDREIARLTPGEHFGEMALTGEDTRSADAVSVGETVLLSIPAEQFWGLVERRDPELGTRLLRNLFMHAADRLRETTEQMVLEDSTEDR